MDSLQYAIRYGMRKGRRYMGAESDPDFIGPPAPKKPDEAAKSANINAVFGGLSSIARSVADSVVQGSVQINKNGISYNGIPSTIPGINQTPPVVAKPDYTKYLLFSIPVIGFLLLAKRK